MTTCAPLTLFDTPEPGSLQEASPVNPQVAPGSSEAAKMTAGSGRMLSESFPLSGPLGRCSKILLASETWTSPEFFLTWQAAGTKQGCSVFRLVPSAPRTGENGTGSSDTGATWQTPTATMIEGGEDRTEKRMEFRRSIGRESFAHGNLGEQMGMLASWPTPAASVPNATEDAESWLARAAELKAKHHNGNGAGMPLAIQLQRESWPTPTSLDHKGVTQTPEQMDYVPNILQADIGPMPSTCLALTESFVVRLTTLSAWLMGYTGAYLAHWAIALSRRSRRASSRP